MAESPKLKTRKGDGACAVHSVFGENRYGMFTKAAPRHFIRDRFGEDAGVFSACVGDAAMIRDLAHVLWQELVQPCAAEAAELVNSRLTVRTEGKLVWQDMACSDPASALQCVDAARSEHHAYEHFKLARTRIVNEFANLCVRSLEVPFVRPLLVHLGMLEEYERETIALPGQAVPVRKLDALFVEGEHRKSRSN